MPKFGRKVPTLDRPTTRTPVSRQTKVRVTGGRGHSVSAKPGGHTVCWTPERCPESYIIPCAYRDRE